jgi:DNA-binding transcriptional MerR regulator
LLFLLKHHYNGLMKLQTIGQLARRVGVRTSTLRYYEEEGLLTPTGRSEAGYRLYDEQAEQTLHFIQRAQRLGFSLADIRTLLEGWQANDLSDQAIIETAQARYLALERQITPLLVLRHELQLFLQDMIQRQRREPDQLHFDRLVEQICGNPLNQPAETMLDWLIQQTDCRLRSDKGRKLLNQLRGQHVHLWQVEQDYHILVVSTDPAIGAALNQLAQLEADCLAHTPSQPVPELLVDDEGYLFIARGDHAFIFARLFLALEREHGDDP